MAEWEQQPDEPDIWYTRFMDYCRMGRSRRIVDVWRSEMEKMQVKDKKQKAMPQTWYVISSGWKWIKRAAAWDREQLNQQTKQCQKKLAGAYERYATIGNELVEMATKLLRDPIRQTALSGADVIKLLAQGVELETAGLREPILDLMEQEDKADATGDDDEPGEAGSETPQEP